MYYRYSYDDDAIKKNVFGVNITGYHLPLTGMDIAYEETSAGRNEEFFDDISPHVWFISEGEGVFVIDDERIDVKTKDVVVVPPNKRIYYYGNLKMLLITALCYKPENEHNVRNIDLL